MSMKPTCCGIFMTKSTGSVTVIRNFNVDIFRKLGDESIFIGEAFFGAIFI